LLELSLSLRLVDVGEHDLLQIKLKAPLQQGSVELLVEGLLRIEFNEVFGRAAKLGKLI